MISVKEIIGKRFGKLVVLGELQKDKYWVKHILCRCDCGVESFKSLYSVIKGTTKSCGCSQHKSHRNHGMSDTSEWAAWKQAKGRCSNKNSKNYMDYGGRGIKMCERWANSFPNFFADMGKKPSPKHSLDRINVDGNYEPSNCRWADFKTQNSNKRPLAKNRDIFALKKENQDLKDYIFHLEAALEFKPALSIK